LHHFTFQEPTVEIKHHLLLKHLTMLYQLVLYGAADSLGKTQSQLHFSPWNLKELFFCQNSKITFLTTLIWEALELKAAFLYWREQTVGTNWPNWMMALLLWNVEKMIMKLISCCHVFMIDRYLWFRPFYFEQFVEEFLSFNNWKEENTKMFRIFLSLNVDQQKKLGIKRDWDWLLCVCVCAGHLFSFFSFFPFLICRTGGCKLLYFRLLKGIRFDLYYLIFRLLHTIFIFDCTLETAWCDQD
jgi:hypothetical protein